MTTHHGLPLLPVQAHVFQKLTERISDSKPSILWAGMMAGKTTICSELSRAMKNTPQIYVGNNMVGMESFHCLPDDYAHPYELPLADGREEDGMWARITPYTIVFIDDLFNIPDAEHLYARVVARTPHVIAMGQIDPYNPDHWPIGKYLSDIIGPYATWEMNPLIDYETLRKSQATRTLKGRRKFNRDTCAAVSMEAWKYWSRDD